MLITNEKFPQLPNQIHVHRCVMLELLFDFLLLTLTMCIFASSYIVKVNQTKHGNTDYHLFLISILIGMVL